jgi:hypothetical protein
MLESLLEHLPLPPVAVLEDFRRLGEFRPFPPSNTPILTWTLMFTPSYSSLTARPILLSLSLLFCLTLSVSLSISLCLSHSVCLFTGCHAVDLSLGNLTFRFPNFSPFSRRCQWITESDIVSSNALTFQYPRCVGEWQIVPTMFQRVW